MSIDFIIKKEYGGKKIKLPRLKEFGYNAYYLFTVVFGPEDVDELGALEIKPGEVIQEPELIYLNEKKKGLELIFEKCY